MIPATHAEIEQIYLASEMADTRSICVTACQSGEGVTSIASALTERYLLAGHQTLLVDFNLFNPAFKAVEMMKSTGGIDHIDSLEMTSGQTHDYWVEHKETARLFTGLTIPQERSRQLTYKDPNTLTHLVNGWLDHFDRVIIDTSPLLNINKGNIPAQSVACACDQTILVVMGGRTTTHQLTTAMSLLHSEKISLLGTILNGKNQPPLRFELIRELNRLPFFPERWKQSVINWIMKSDILSTYS